MDGDDMIRGEVYKKKSAWWFSKQRDGSTLVLSTKHRTQRSAIQEAENSLNEGYIDDLNIYNGKGEPQ